jgi:magnesium-transporting ATPase (P-type)
MPPPLLTAPHTLSATQVADALGVDVQRGLSLTEAESRLRQYGPNKVKGAEGLSMWEILMRQVSNSLTLAHENFNHGFASIIAIQQFFNTP